MRRPKHIDFPKNLFFNNLLINSSINACVRDKRIPNANIVQEQTPNILMFAIVVLSFLIESINQLKDLIANEIIIGVKINNNVSVLAKHSINIMPIVYGVSLIGLLYNVCPLF